MNGEINGTTADHLPWFLPGPDGSDPLFTFTVFLMLGIILLIGNLYLTLHAVPERMAHHSNHTQQQAITILALLALFTHNNIFWLGALLLAVVRWPDIQTPLENIAGALERIAPEGLTRPRRAAPPEAAPDPSAPDPSAPGPSAPATSAPRTHGEV
jgi:hypothetical protein